MQGKVEVHTEMVKGGRLDIEPRLPTLIKVKILEKLSPCTLSFNYEDNSDLVVYVSLTNLIPNERNCKYFKHRPTKMQINGL